MKRRTFLKSTSALSLATLITPFGIIQAKTSSEVTDELDRNFFSPPVSARPHTWWHWMNGNVTKEGITLDLEAMAQVGIGGFQNFDAGTGIPKGPVQYLSEEWLELKKHAIKEAERLGLEFTMHNCPGWSSSGGPWITPELSMQEVTWSETYVTGGKESKVQLAQPLTRLKHYKDIAVVAYPSLDGELSLHKIVKNAFTNTGKVDIRSLTGESTTEVVINPSLNDKKTGFLLLEFSQPYACQTVSFLTSSSSGSGSFSVEFSDNGIVYKEIVSVQVGGFGSRPGDVQLVRQNFSPVKARFIRLTCNHVRNFSQLRFSNVRLPDGWDKRANYSFNRMGVDDIQSDTAIPVKRIIDLTPLLSSTGSLSWKAPKGNWTILRVGFTTLATENRSAPDTGIGLECDKYSASALEFHFNKMMENLLPSLSGMGAKGQVGLLIDSYEVGMQNWTPGFEKAFKSKMGYDITPYLLTITGRVVESADITNRFLWDLRRTQGDMMADNYYGKFTDLCHQHKIISYIQPYDRGPMEEMQIGSRVDVNVGEFWNGLSSIFQNNWTMRRTVKLSASIAHINGQKIVAAESFTGEPESSRWQEYPYGLKALGDKMFSQGLNRIIFHRFAHQPHPTAKPGMTMGPWGIHFDRTNTWWEGGKSWLEYISRCQYLLQQGNFVADLAYFTGEDAGVYTKVSPDELSPAPPIGYDYDLINAEVLLKKASVLNNRLQLPSGVSYGILILQQPKTMTLPLLRKIHQMVTDGLVVVGARPLKSPGLQTYAEGDVEFKKITVELWGSINGTSITKNSVGKGSVVWGESLESVLEQLSLKRDVEISSESGDAPITWIHRKTKDADIYFLANQRRRYENILCSFRLKGKQPELWDAVNGKNISASIYEHQADRTLVPLKMPPAGSVFVVFRHDSDDKRIVSIRNLKSEFISTRDFSNVVRNDLKTVTNNFTLSLWAKPETNVMLSTRNFMDGQQPWTDNFALYPGPGKIRYGEKHATCGLAIGRNGVVVWEHHENKPEFVLASPASLSGWSNVVLVYESGVPSVYVNGIRIQKGSASAYTIHPETGYALLQEGASYYNGDLTDPVLFHEVLSESRIKELAETPIEYPYNHPVAIEQAGVSKKMILFFENGEFEITDSLKRTSIVKIDGTRKVNLSDAWEVSFPDQTGAPENIKLSTLMALNKHPDLGVKYFSGTAFYKKNITITPAELAKNKKIFLDLGQVEVLAEVILNGKNLGTLWARPYRCEISEALHVGENILELCITNLWPNRLIGDEQLSEPYQYTPGGGGSGFASLGGGAILELPEWYKKGEPKPDDGRITFATWKHYTKESPLLESGLIGPVILQTAIEHEV